MKQIYAVGSCAGRVNTNGNAANHGSTRPALRAASAGLKSEEVQSLLSLVNYAVAPSQSIDGEQLLPVRLALLNTDAGRVLTHVAPRDGQYFAHALLNVPAMADAHLAIQTWGSPFWLRHEPESTADLPELPYLPVADKLGDDSLRDWLTPPLHRDLLEYVLTALLGTPSSTRIFVQAPADVVARIVYAITRALPPGLLEDFTFSTYETDPLSCQARLVGCDSRATEVDLPAVCYSPGNAAFNLNTGSRFDLGVEVPFAAFAVAALAKGDYTPLDDVKATWQRLGLKKEARQFDLVYRLTRGTGVLTKEEAAAALQHPPLAAWISARSDALQQFLEWALDDRTFATASFSWVVQALRQKSDVTTRLGQTVRELGLQALKAGDLTRTANAFEVVLPMALPAKAGTIWGELLEQISQPGALTWELRWYLLPRFARFRKQQGTAIVDPVLSKWLDVPAEKLRDLLALDLPRTCQLAAVRISLQRDAEPGATLVQGLGGNPTLTLAVLQPSPEVDNDRLVKLFEALLREAPGFAWFEELLARSGEYPAALLNRFFETVLSTGKVDAERVIRSQGSRLLEIFAGQSGLDRVGSQFLLNPPADLLNHPGLLDFLARLRDEPQISPHLKTRIVAVQTVRSFLDGPTFAPDAVAPVASALALQPAVVHPNTTEVVFSTVANEVGRRAKSDALQADLETVLLHLGPVLAGNASDLYLNLLREARKAGYLWKQANAVHAFLALALGAAQTEALTPQLEGLEGQAFALAAEASRRGGRRVLDEVDRRTEAWPKAARTQWSFLSTAVRPRGFRGFVRDCALVAAGAAGATAIWWILHQIGQ